MRVISIDVGIKNLAYCIVEGDSIIKKYKIIQWDVINLCGSEKVCNCALKPKVKKGVKKGDKKNVIEEQVIFCNKKASFLKTIDNTTNYYCQTHAKISGYLLPNKSLKNIKSWKRDALLSYVQTLGIVHAESDKKDILIKNILEYLKDKQLENISSVSANEMTLIQMGIKLVEEFDKVLALEHIDHIVIENQISPIANRMKTLQGMIAQYFIMREKTVISFISSANKLKVFSKTNMPIATDTISAEQTNNAIATGPSNYGERKKEGIKKVKELLEQSDNSQWMDIFLTHKKKDDMADSFLQGVWFLSSKC